MMLLALWYDLLGAVQFLTRIPVGMLPYDTGSLARSSKFFPAVGLLIGGSAAALLAFLRLHLASPVAAVLTVASLILVTGCLHEDALADAADGFGGGHDREHILRILKDSSIGSYGGTALTLNLVARVGLLSALPTQQATHYLVVAHVLCRWTTLPLSFFLPPATSSGQGSRIAYLTSRSTLLIGTIFSLAVALLVLRRRALPALLGAALLTFVTGLYYKRRLGGVTGDCFGATNQLTESLIYLLGAWIW